MDLGLSFFAGHVLVAPAMPEDPVIVSGEIRELAREFARHYRGLLRPMTVQKPRATKGFSFHWSNAQAAWSVILANDPTWMLDGADFLVYFRPGVLSPVGKPWSLKDMQTIAKMLPPHPGYASSVEGGERGVSAARVAARYHRPKVPSAWGAQQVETKRRMDMLQLDAAYQNDVGKLLLALANDWAKEFGWNQASKVVRADGRFGWNIVGYSAIVEDPAGPGETLDLYAGYDGNGNTHIAADLTHNGKTRSVHYTGFGGLNTGMAVNTLKREISRQLDNWRKEMTE